MYRVFQRKERDLIWIADLVGFRSLKAAQKHWDDNYGENYGKVVIIHEDHIYS